MKFLRRYNEWRTHFFGRLGQSKTPATLVGTAIGDALGMPFEMMKPDHEDLKAWKGEFQDSKTNPYHSNKAGQWTDDTQMSVALTESIVAAGKYDPERAAQAYLAWFTSDDCRGMGGTTRKALTQLKNGKKWDECGITGFNVGGNGTAMRAAPLGVLFRERTLGELQNVVHDDAIITHNTEEAVVGSWCVALATALLASGKSSPRSIISDVLKLTPKTNSSVRHNVVTAQRVLDMNLKTVDALKIIGTSGTVWETVAAALYCFARHSTYQDSVLAAVRGGGDADTVAAITGALAGTFYGLEGIPKRYLDGVERLDYLKKLDAQLYAIA